jgi:hypothetical protein
MRAMDPLRSCMRSGLGSLSRILVCSVEGPRGAKLAVSRGLDAVGDAGRESPLPSPYRVVSTPRFVIRDRRSPTFQKLRQRRILQYYVLHGCATASCVWASSVL